MSRIEIGPGLVTLLGGAPGAGKTAFVMQAVVDALRLTPTLRAVVCNIEMPPGVLLDRQLARLSGVDLTTIRYRRLTEEHAERIDAGLNTLDELAERLAFVRPPFDLANVAAVADEFFSEGAGLIVLDYIQRIQPPGEHGDKRGSVDATMSHLRAFADAGVAVIVLSAVGRTKDKAGRSSYSGDGLNLASFRESSELEFGADDAFILTPDDEVILRHLKSRNGECRDVRLQFDKPHQAFTPLDGANRPRPQSANHGASCKRRLRTCGGERPPPMTMRATMRNSFVGGRADDSRNQRTPARAAGLFGSAADGTAAPSTGIDRERQAGRETEANGGNVKPLRRTECVRRLFDGGTVSGRSPDVARSVAGHEERDGANECGRHCETDRSDPQGSDERSGGVAETRVATARSPRGADGGSVGLSRRTVGQTDRLTWEAYFSRLREACFPGGEVSRHFCGKRTSHIP